jgi:hypothetical protein
MPQLQQLYLTLPSNSRDFPSNKTSNYRVRLANPVELGGAGDWECGLAQIDYPHSFDNVASPDDASAMRENLFAVKLAGLDGGGKMKIRRLKLWFAIPEGSYDTVDGLVDAVNNSISKTDFKPETLAKYNNNNAGGRRGGGLGGGWSSTELKRVAKWYKKKRLTDGPPVFLAYNPDVRRIHFNNKWATNVSLLFSAKLQYILGIGGERWVRLSPSTGYITDYPPDLTAGFNTLFIYCSLIEPQIVGNALSPLLRTVAIEGKQGDFVSSVFHSPHYLKVQTKTFDTVDVAIKNDQGGDVRFNYGKVIVKLHLRRVNKQSS